MIVDFRFTIYDFRLSAQANAKENFRFTIVDFRLNTQASAKENFRFTIDDCRLKEFDNRSGCQVI
ncbi:hypothetical protein [Culturomica massiliensis]|uniref:hypothetical protein n=1 Tax=Culturomica massiliensis TaxID=1841857 RepID=UPI00266589F9|nr:hypothetical protein [Culturomica massiliensis]